MQRFASVLVTLPFLFTIALPLSASAVDCSGVAGTHPATADEVPGVSAGTCVPDNQQNNGGLNGGCDFNPYPILQQFNSGAQIAPSSGGGTELKDGINPALACRLAQFFKYAQTQGCTYKISSAYRSAAKQASVCQSICGNPGGCTGSAKCGAPGGSCHQYGLAVDIDSSAQCMSWAQKTLGVGSPGTAGQQFKIFFPMPSDTVHVQCTENRVGNCSPSTQPCDGSVRINPDLSGIPRPGSSLPFDQQARQALGMQPSPPPPSSPPATPSQQTPATSPTATTQTQTNTTSQTPPSTDTLNTTPYPAGTCAPQTRCVQDDGNIYYRATTCVDQLYKKCDSGCTGLICNATSSSSGGNSFLSDFFSTSTSNQSSNGSKATSTFDLIDFFANPPSLSSTAIGTATPIDINQNIQDTGNAEILGAAPQQNSSDTLGTGPTGGLSSGLIPQQTFTSGDLSNSPASYSLQPTSTFQQVLAQMRSVLVAMIPYVQPFGGIRQTQILE